MLIFIKGNSLSGETVDVWGFKDVISVAADMVCTLLVGNNEQEVGLFIGHRQSPGKE